MTPKANYTLFNHCNRCFDLRQFRKKTFLGQRRLLGQTCEFGSEIVPTDPTDQIFWLYYNTSKKLSFDAQTESKLSCIRIWCPSLNLTVSAEGGDYTMESKICTALYRRQQSDAPQMWTYFRII